MAGHPDTDGDNGLSAAESLALIEQQGDRVQRTLEPDVVLVYGVWGAAWVLGFASFALVYSDTVDVPRFVPGVVLFASMLTAIAVTSVHFARAFRGIRGQSSLVGAMYGWTWFGGFLCMGTIMGGLARADVSDEVFALLSPALSLLVVGLLYMAGGALWQDRVQYGLGAWILLVAAVAAVAGVPGNYVVLTVAGGGGFLAAALYFALRRAADRRRAAS